jgi:CHASE2 domain-containing sensor protein
VTSATLKSRRTRNCVAALSYPPSGYFAIDYRRADPPVRRRSIIDVIDVIEGRSDPREVAGRVVFIGATSGEFQDRWTPPLGPAIPGG